MFKLDDLIIDRILSGVALSSDGKTVLYRLSQLSDATIETTSESRDVNDARGTRIKTFYYGKTGTLNANNALLNLSILGAQSGSGKDLADDKNILTMPAIQVYKPQAGAIPLPGGDIIADSVRVTQVANNGALLTQYRKDTTSSAETFAVSDTGELTLPTDTDVAEYEVFYRRKVKSGVTITNRADKFPGTVQLILKALAVDPCDVSTTLGIYIEIPSFQVSPDVNIQIGGTDSQQLAYNGNLQVNYCSPNKELYKIHVADGDIEQVG